MDTIFAALDLAGVGPLLLSIVIGLVVGIIFGVLPGMGPLLGIALAIPFTFYMDPVPSIALLMGIYQGGNFGGAVTAIMIGVPGTPMAAATLLDGYPMARGGRVSDALILATLSSFSGAMISALLLILLSPYLAAAAANFGHMETMLLVALGLSTVASLTGRSLPRGLLSAALGLAAAAIGTDPILGLPRLTMGLSGLDGGFNLVALLMGLFAVSELLAQVAEGDHRKAERVHLQLRNGILGNFIRRWANWLRSSALGIFIGAIPGIGGDASAYIAYRVSRDFSDEPEKFGQGADDGVVASESANSATTGGALLPMLAIGIPGDPVVAALMGGFLIQGLTPGPQLFEQQPEIVYGVLAAFLLGAMLLLPIALVMLRALIRTLAVPKPYLVAAVGMFSVLGVFMVQRYMFDLWVFFAFGLIGYVLRLAAMPLAPVIIGYVLGSAFEEELRMTSLVTGGDWVGFFLNRPASQVILALLVLVLFAPVVQALLRRRALHKHSSSTRETHS